MLNSNEAGSYYCILKESIRNRKIQAAYIEIDKLIKEGKMMGTGEIIKQNEKINIDLRSKSWD